VLAWLSVWREVQNNDLHMVQLMPLPPYYLASLKSFLVPAYPGCPGKEIVKRVSALYVALQAIN